MVTASLQWLGSRLLADTERGQARFAHVLESTLASAESDVMETFRLKTCAYDFSSAFDYLGEAEPAAVMEHAVSLSGPGILTLAAFDHLTRLSVDKQAFAESAPMESVDQLRLFVELGFAIQDWVNSDEETAVRNEEVNDLLAEVASAASESGVPLLVGSDAGNHFQSAGESTLQELTLLQAAGLSFPALLRAATSTAASALEREDLGCLEPGCVADLLVLDSDPRESLVALQTLRGVMSDGRWLAADTLKDLRERASDRTDLLWSSLEFAEALWEQRFGS